MYIAHNWRTNERVIIFGSNVLLFLLQSSSTTIFNGSTLPTIQIWELTGLLVSDIFLV